MYRRELIFFQVTNPDDQFVRQQPYLSFAAAILRQANYHNFTQKDRR